MTKREESVLPEETSHREVIQRTFAALATGDSRPLLDLLADYVTWKVMGRTPWSRTYRGKRAC